MKNTNSNKNCNRKKNGNNKNSKRPNNNQNKFPKKNIPKSKNKKYSNNKKSNGNGKRKFNKGKKFVKHVNKQINKISIKLKLYNSIEKEKISNNNGSGKVYINMLKGMERGKKVAYSKDCKMEKIFYIIFINKDGYIEVVKMHFLKPDMTYKKMKSSYLGKIKINFKDLNKFKMDDNTYEEVNDIMLFVTYVESLVKNGCYITSLPKNKEESKNILDTINKVLSEENS